jgi:hypothetical protein
VVLTLRKLRRLVFTPSVRPGNVHIGVSVQSSFELRMLIVGEKDMPEFTVGFSVDSLRERLLRSKRRGRKQGKGNRALLCRHAPNCVKVRHDAAMCRNILGK